MEAESVKETEARESSTLGVRHLFVFLGDLS